MVCKKCHGLLYGHKGRRDSAAQLDLTFSHHESEKNVQDAAENSDCYICRIICEKLKSLGVRPPTEVPASSFTSATIQRFSRHSGVYRLDFKLEGSNLRVASFGLKHIQGDNERSPSKEDPISASTADPKVFELARTWIEECEREHPECRLVDSTQWHPTRLIDLQPMQTSSNRMVRLVSQKDSEKVPDQPIFEGRYMTLSHRWGNLRFTKLRRKTLSEFQTAIVLETLPLTFQHAVRFATVLGIRWLWIDALCILQGDEDDWLLESAQMDKVYTYSWCNISATASVDSSEGLFRDRDPDKPWFDKVTLKTQDLLVDAAETIPCIITDLNFWPVYVENAPVNVRSWVFQERLLAPRVVHWCADQIAFECHTLDRAECRPEGLPNLQMMSNQLLDQARLKVMNREAGRRLRETRLAASQGASNPRGLEHMVNGLAPRFHIYEVWKRIVETYTKMEITQQRDRLIALSGIARMMAELLRRDREQNASAENDDAEDVYIAGMWKTYLESQLLWYVNDKEGVAVQPRENTRPSEPRAPSFSWASVETARGVTFPETTDQNIMVEVQVVRLLYKTEADTFGIITDGYLVLKGVLRKIVLTDALEAVGIPSTSTNTGVPFTGNRYSWRLTNNGVPFGEPQSIVYLDSPASEPTIFGPTAQVYCLPVSEDHRHLNCLLVQATDGDHGVRYKRVGLTKILALYDEEVELFKKLTEPPGRKETLLGKYYRGSNEHFWGESHICII